MGDVRSGIQKPAQPLLQFSNVSKSFGSLEVLKNACGVAKAGQRVLLKGANGSGKTTLLKVLAGLLTPDDGEVLRGSVVAWIPAIDAGFWPRLNGLSALELYARLWKVPDDRFQKHIASWSSSTVFRDSLKIPTYQLSTGRRQLLHFARALMHQPQIILVDEPFRSLDEENRKFAVSQIDGLALEALVVVSSPTDLTTWNWNQTWKFENGKLS